MAAGVVAAADSCSLPIYILEMLPLSALGLALVEQAEQRVKS
jgi:hypothetical protein